MAKRKKKYLVLIPIAGHVEVEVEALNETAAKDAAWEAINDGYKHPDPEWEYHDKIVEGNCCHVSLYETEVEEIK